MTDYRVYLIGIDNSIVKAIHINCPDDEAAIAAARPFIEHNDIELWHGDRRVAKFDANYKNPCQT